MLIPQAVQHRYFTKRENFFLYALNGVPQHDCSAMFVVESTTASCLSARALERARLDGQALLLAGSDLPECVEVFLQELLRSLIGPIQADTRIDGELSLAMIVDVFDVNGNCSERRRNNHRLLNDTGRTAGRESEVTFRENRERHFRMLAQPG